MSSSSPQISPTTSLHASPETTLQRLISHFVAAKRSLSATSHVYRANEIVGSARGLIEENAVLGAKNAFLERGVSEEANALSAVRDALETVFRDTNSEFKATLKSLDHAHIKLQGTIQLLKETVVDPSLASKEYASLADDLPSPSAYAHDNPRALYDFISESGHQTLLDALRDDLDSYNAMAGLYLDSQTAFDSTLAMLAKALRQVDTSLADNRESSIQGEDPDRPHLIPDLFHALTSHATETASLLQSLIEHYDLCSTALKHTEGGGEAARAAAESTTAAQDIEGMDQSLYEGNNAREPITDDERNEMLTVLENDAHEVDDVVFEIRERISEMEAYLSQISDHAISARTCHAYLAKVLQLLYRISNDLPAHISCLKAYTASWSQIKENLKHKLTEITGLDAIYEGFLRSYGLLLKEVGRRASAEAKVKRVLDKAKREVDAMCDNELDIRKDFLRDVSDFLPRDIWPALVEAPKRWEFKAVAQEDLGEGDPTE